MRLLCILLPHFPLNCEVLRHPELNGRVAVITRAVGSQRLVLDYSPELEGITRDMPLQQALSLHGDIEVIHADVPHYWSVFTKVLDALELKSPLVEGTDLGEVYLGLDGLQSIYKSDDILVKSVCEAIPAVFDASFGIAEAKFPSYVAALHSPPGSYKALAGNMPSFLKELSCDLLPVSSKSKERLHDFGLHTLGQLTTMLCAHLEAQFGTEGRIIWQLASGQDETPLYPRMSQEIIEESTTLSSPTVSLDLMLMTLESMLARVFTKLSQSNMGVQGITLWTRTWIGEHWEQAVHFKEPAMNTKDAVSRIRHVMENTPQPGPVEQLGMKVIGIGRFFGKQKSLISAVRDQEHLLDDIKQMEMRLGAPQLFQVKEVEPWSRIPERRYTLKPVNR
jgi:DNA polymerase-4